MRSHIVELFLKLKKDISCQMAFSRRTLLISQQFLIIWCEFKLEMIIGGALRVTHSSIYNLDRAHVHYVA